MSVGRKDRGSGRKREEQGRGPDQQMGIYTHTMRNGFQVKKNKIKKNSQSLIKKINYLKTNMQTFLPKGGNSLLPMRAMKCIAFLQNTLLVKSNVSGSGLCDTLSVENGTM